MAEEPPRTFVSFSSADVDYYRTMQMWQSNEHVDFNFRDFQLEKALNSLTPGYIKDVCRRKIRRVDTFVLLIGADTYTKTVYVKDEVETAIEKGCRLIGANLNGGRFKDWLCPLFFADRGAVFIPFSSRIMAHAFKNYYLATPPPNGRGDRCYLDQTYVSLGYELRGNTAVLPPAPNPFAGGNRPPWAK